MPDTYTGNLNITQEIPSAPFEIVFVAGLIVIVAGITYSVFTR